MHSVTATRTHLTKNIGKHGIVLRTQRGWHVYLKSLLVAVGLQSTLACTVSYVHYSGHMVLITSKLLCLFAEMVAHLT